MICKCFLPSTFLPSLRDVAAADVGAVGDAASVVDAVANGPAPQVHLHAAPEGGDIDGDATDRALGRTAEDGVLAIGAIHQHVDVVVVVSEGVFVIRVEDDRCLLRVVELGGAELHGSTVTLSHDNASVVNAHAVGSGSLNVGEVELHKLTEDGRDATLATAKKANVETSQHCGSEFASGGETGTPKLLSFGVGVAYALGVGGHREFTAIPFSSDDGSDSVPEVAKDTFLIKCHNVLVFRLLLKLILRAALTGPFGQCHTLLV